MFAVGACRLRNTLPENDTDRINIDVFTNLFIRLISDNFINMFYTVSICLLAFLCFVSVFCSFVVETQSVLNI